MTGQRLLTLQDVADMLRLSPHTIRAMCRQHRLEPVRICRRLLFDPVDVEQLVKRNSGKKSDSPMEAAECAETAGSNPNSARVARV